MNEREKFINDNIVDAKYSSGKADIIAREREEKLAKCQIDAKALVARKISDANENSRTLTDNAKLKSKEDIKNAKDALLDEAGRTEQELELKINEIADVISSKILEQSWIFGTQ